MWKKQIKLIFTPIAVLVILAFSLFVVNQLHQVYTLASTVNETFALVVLISLSALIIGLVSLPFYLFLTLPRTLKRDELDASTFREKYFRRLKKNKYLRSQGVKIQNASEVEKALEHLNQEADRITKTTASSVFLTTAISQNGKLDALTVLITQSRMVWKIAHLYYQRPTLSELTNLYGNIAAATFLASEIEDIDITEQLEPVLRGFVKNSAGKAIPFIGPTANLVMDSLLEGSTNAFLTLRVGILTKRYCASLDTVNAKGLRRSAIAEASSLLSTLVFDSSGKVVNALLKTTKKVGMDSIRSSVGSVKKTLGRVKKGVVTAKDKMIRSSDN